MAISIPTKSVQFLRDSVGSLPYTAGKPELPIGVLQEVAVQLVFTAAGFTSAAAGDLSLISMPPGKIRILLDASTIICPIGTANSDLDLGVSAYTKWDGTTQSLQGNLLADSLAVGGAALNQALGVGSVIVDSYSGFSVVASFDTANSPAAGTLVLKLVYQREP